MSSIPARQQRLIEWGVASRPIVGQTVSGDLHLVKEFDHGVLLAAVDGVGHGDKASSAARVAVAILERHAQEPVISLFERCHEALIHTRGVVMTLAFVYTFDQTLTWLGVGNVEGRLLRPGPKGDQQQQSALLRGGLVGGHLPALQPGVVPLQSGDLLILATDGIHAGFADGIRAGQAPHQIADRILNQHFKGTDDALVLVARYLGRAHE